MLFRSKTPGVEAVLLQEFKSGLELFVGAKKEKGFGHLILAGLGGIFIEVFKDIASGLSPVGRNVCETRI